MEPSGQLGKIGVEKVKILENKEDAARGDNAHDQKPFSSSSFCPFDQQSRGVVNDDREGQNENINRYERHIKNAARQQEKKPTISMGDQKIEESDRGEEYQK